MNKLIAVAIALSFVAPTVTLAYGGDVPVANCHPSNMVTPTLEAGSDHAIYGDNYDLHKITDCYSNQKWQANMSAISAPSAIDTTSYPSFSGTIKDEWGIEASCPAFLGSCSNNLKSPEYRASMIALGKQLIALGFERQFPQFAQLFASVR